MSDNHDMPRQRETQRYDAKQRSAPRQRSQSRRRRSPSRQRYWYQKEDRTHTVRQSPALDETVEALPFDSVNNESGDTHNEIFATINITLEDRPHIPATLKAKVDTGASGNILPLRIFRRMYPTKLNAEGFPAQRTLVPSNDTKIQQHRTMAIPCSFRGKRCDAEFYVSSSTGPAILGLPSCRELRLVQMNCEVNETLNRPNPEAPIASKSDLIDTYPDRFEGIGSFRGEFHITIDKSVPPVVHSPRRCPIHLKDEVKTELDKMEELGVITNVSAPTDWVSSIVHSRKSNNKLRIYLDPTDLNRIDKASSLQNAHVG